MKYFVGIDVSMEESSICIVDDDGIAIEEMVAVTHPESIAETLADYENADLKIGVETGAMTSWLWHEITAMGYEIAVLDARSLHQVLKMQRNKTDRNNAYGIEQVLRTGWYREAHVKSYESHALRALLKARSHLV